MCNTDLNLGNREIQASASTMRKSLLLMMIQVQQMEQTQEQKAL